MSSPISGVGDDENLPDAYTYCLTLADQLELAAKTLRKQVQLKSALWCKQQSRKKLGSDITSMNSDIHNFTATGQTRPLTWGSGTKHSRKFMQNTMGYSHRPSAPQSVSERSMRTRTSAAGDGSMYSNRTESSVDGSDLGQDKGGEGMEEDSSMYGDDDDLYANN